MSEGEPPPAPTLRQFFGSPKADDDVFSQLTDAGHQSAVMASQVNLAQSAHAAPPPAAHLAQPGPPQLLQVSEMAPNVEQTFKQELQEALEYEERRPRFSIGPESADEVSRLVAEVQCAEPEAAGEASAGDATASDGTTPPQLDLPSPAHTADGDAGDVTAQGDEEEVPLTDDVTPPAPPAPPFEGLPSGSASADLELAVTPDDPAMSGELTASCLPNTEMDRQFDAWVPSEETQRVLSSMSQSLPGTFYPRRDSLTLPGCSLQSELTDPVSELMLQYMTSAEARRRSVLTADSVTQDDRGIRQLIQAGCYRAAVNLTGRLLTNYGQGYGRVGQVSKHTANSVQLWFTRLALLVRLRLFPVAEQEAEAWGDLDTADLFFQYYPDLYGGRRGSLVPFNFRVLLAELPRYSAHYQASLDRLYQIHAVCQQILSNLSAGRAEDGSPSDLSEGGRQRSLALWNSRRLKVIFSVVNCCVGMKDYEQAITCLGQLAAELPESAAALRSAVGRVYLQLGNLAAGACRLRHRDKPPSESDDSRLSAQLLINDAFLAIGENNFAEAQAKFERALQLEPENATVLTNLSVCLLYQGRLADAVTMLETAVFSRPELLQETVLLNLCTLYELQTSKCNRKKVELLSRVGGCKGDGFNVGCLKLQSAT
ncbi:trafficking protein particle complex subunit 12-like [Pollicipes pollicipes]|uniref:trafficking protein particle complex subunit 12-like n=1 Tax=Pollicipes pollicipes TaxID=41117 RepID=UPI001884F84D|nr:trafficking protein particle complex subunit 12-like [Pollicipes pollicipes]